MKEKTITFDKVCWHDAVFRGMNIDTASKKGSKIKLLLNIYLNEESQNRTSIKLIFKNVEKLTVSTDFHELLDNKNTGNIDLAYITNKGYTFNLFGGIIYIETQIEPNITLGD